MLNFKEVVMGEFKNLDDSQWPELSKIDHRGNETRKKSAAMIEMNEENKRSESNSNGNRTNVDYTSSAFQPSSSKNSLPSHCDFPNLTDTIDNQLEKRNRFFTVCKENGVIGDSKIIKENNCASKYKKPKKCQPRAPISIDVDVMLRISLSIAEKRRQHKRIQRSYKRSLPLQEQLLAKSIACGNKLDSDCPKRYKGKKRPHKRQKVTTIKRHFQWAADKSFSRGVVIPRNKFLSKKMCRLRQKLLTGLRQGQTIEDLVTDLGRLDIDDGQNQQLVNMDYYMTAKDLVHTKNFRPYCDHILKPNIKDKVKEFITTLRIYQDKLYARDAINSKSRRRFVCGCHEARKFLRIDSVKLLFVANNLIVDNGMPPILEELLQKAKDSALPVMFPTTALNLGVWTKKNKKTSVIAVLNYEGAEKLFHELLEELEQAKKDYQTLLQNVSQLLQKRDNGETYDLDKNEFLQLEVEEQIRENIISKLS